MLWKTVLALELPVAIKPPLPLSALDEECPTDCDEMVTLPPALICAATKALTVGSTSVSADGEPVANSWRFK